MKHIDSKYEPTIFVDKVIGQVLELLEFLTSLLKSTKSLFCNPSIKSVHSRSSGMHPKMEGRQSPSMKSLLEDRMASLKCNRSVVKL